jgi:hypothetical protein
MTVSLCLMVFSEVEEAMAAGMTTTIYFRMVC